MPMMPMMPGMPQSILLKDAKPRKLPTDDRGAVRIRALPKADIFGDAAEGEILLALEASPEPRLQWQSFQSIRIDKAVDDQDQQLKQVTPQVPGGPGFPGAPGGIGAPPGARRPPMMGPMGAFMGRLGQPVAVQLKKGDKAAKSLKELTGTLSAYLLSEAKPMITADNLAKAGGKTFKGDDGGSIKVVEVKTDEQKQLTIQFEFEQPPETTPAMPTFMAGSMMMAPGRRPPAAGGPGGPGGPAVGRRGPGAAGFVGPINGLSIQDAKGNALPIQMDAQQFRVVVGPGGANGFTYTLTCAPGKDQGEPAKLVYLGRKSVLVEIPFTLKDVPLP
jgi:hypothetical protein